MEDLQLQSAANADITLGERSQKDYTRSVRRPSQFSGKPLDQITEKEFRDYFLQ